MDMPRQFESIAPEEVDPNPPSPPFGHSPSNPASEHFRRRASAAESGQVTLSISPDQYERLFLQPTPAVGDLSKRFGNPTLLGLLGFIIPFQPTMFCLMGFAGTTPESVTALAGMYIFFGGMVMSIAGILEWVLGNTFVFALFILFAAHYAQAAFSVIPPYTLVAQFGPDGKVSKEYNSALGFYYISFCITSFCFMLSALRTNVAFLLGMFTLVPLFAITAAAYIWIGYHPDEAGLAYANYLNKVAGGFGFVTCFCAWYLIIILSCASTGVPCPLPTMDLSTRLFANTKAARDEAAGAGGGAVAKKIARRMSRRLSSVTGLNNKEAD